MAMGKSAKRTTSRETRSAVRAAARRHAKKAPFAILLVEDSPVNRTITLAFLQDEQCRVDVAENGAVALKKFTAGRYDLVLMDRQMPVMDGLAATRAIRKWEIANGKGLTPIIALTASALAEDREKCAAAGCTGYLTKPVRQDALLRAIGQQSTAVLVHADPRFADLIPGFLQHRRQDVAAILEALDRGDFRTVERLGHDMRGAGGNYGFQPITDIGAALERSAGRADAGAVRKWAGELARYLDRVEVV